MVLSSLQVEKCWSLQLEEGIYLFSHSGFNRLYITNVDTVFRCVIQTNIHVCVYTHLSLSHFLQARVIWTEKPQLRKYLQQMPAGKSVGHCLGLWLIWKNSAHCGRCHPWLPLQSLPPCSCPAWVPGWLSLELDCYLKVQDEINPFLPTLPLS